MVVGQITVPNLEIITILERDDGRTAVDFSKGLVYIFDAFGGITACY